MTDTQGANAVGCYGEPGLGTPSLDRLAAEGIRFERAYTTCPLCTPARSGIFTGLYPSINGAHTNNLAPGANIPTMGQRFRDGGYRTAYIGKWHLDGLDYFDSGICPDGWKDEYWYDGRRWRYYNDQNGLLDGSVWSMTIDGQGRPWAAGTTWWWRYGHTGRGAGQCSARKRSGERSGQ